MFLLCQKSHLLYDRDRNVKGFQPKVELEDMKWKISLMHLQKNATQELRDRMPTNA